MRRRALLMASMTSGGGGGGTYDEVFGEIPPESTEFGWPLYITVPYIENVENFRNYEKPPSDIGLQLYNWIMENYEEDQSMFVSTCFSYPPELYINGERIEYFSWDVFMGQMQQNPSFHTAKIFEGFIREDGLISVDVMV